MAFLVTDTFYEIAILNLNDPAWATIPEPDIPSALVTAMVTGATIVIYVIDSATGTFAYEGGQASGWDDVVLSASASLAQLVTDTTDGWSIVSCLNSASAWRIYDSSSGTIRIPTAGDQAALKAFL